MDPSDCNRFSGFRFAVTSADADPESTGWVRLGMPRPGPESERCVSALRLGFFKAKPTVATS